MPSVDDATENVVWGAADAFLSNNLDDLLDEIFERVHEDGDVPDEVVDDVVSDWISRMSVADAVHECGARRVSDSSREQVRRTGDVYEKIDDECTYTDDCMEIIADYGFSDSLSAALEFGCNLAYADETAVASAVLTLNMPSDDTMQDEIIRQIKESREFLQRVEEAGY